MRYHAYGRRPRTVFRQILSRGHVIYFVRRGSDFSLSLGVYFPPIALVRVRGNASVHRDSAGGLFLSLEERGVGLESPSRAPGPRFVTETPDLEKNPTIAKIRASQPRAISELIFFRGELTVVVPREYLRSLAEFLARDKELAFTYLSDVTGVDRFPIEPRL